MTGLYDRQFDLAIIGTGLSGLSAALFAARRKLCSVLIGGSGESNFASGLLDLLGVYPLETRRVRTNPWEAIAELKRSESRHPYRYVDEVEIAQAFKETTDFLAEKGLPYAFLADRNVEVLTSLGTTKVTYGVPQNMWAGVEVLARKRPCLLVDMVGLKGFSARQIAEIGGPWFSRVKTVRVAWPETKIPCEQHAEHMAKSLDSRENLRGLAEKLMPHTRGAEAIGLPSVIGFYNSAEAVAELELLTGLKIFEIPGLLPSVPGLRLKGTFESNLPDLGVECLFNSRVLRAMPDNDTGFLVEVGHDTTEKTLRAKAIILATGRFVGKGLYGNRGSIQETVFNLPVHQPTKREDWHSRDFFDPRGHQVNKIGLETDDSMRPLNNDGHPAYDSLFAAGSILAHQDWKRMKCGAGLAMATAFKAVTSYVHLRQ